MREYKNLPAQFNERIHGFGVDYGIIFLTILIVVFMQWNPIYKVLVIIVVFYVFHIGPSFIKRGISLGKWNSKTIVVTSDFKEVSLGTMHLRETFIFVFGFLTIGIYFILAFYLLSKRIDQRSIHDLLFKTRVVNYESKLS